VDFEVKPDDMKMQATQALATLRVEAGYRRRFAERHLLEDRGRDEQRLLIVIAGHKPLLWPATLARIRDRVPAGTDVCLVTPGVHRGELASMAADSGWSYLSTRGGHVSVAQNLAIRAHPHAQWVFKIDEDVFIGEGFFEQLFEGYRRVREEAEFSIGFCAPVLNVNGFSYVDYMRTLDIEAPYVERFGPARRASDGIPVQHDGEAAVWLWSHGLPVDDVARRFAERPFGFAIVPHRFSIGAILFERDLWQEMRGFPRLTRSPGLGEDEQAICVACLSLSRVMVVIENLYAGHFAFGAQSAAMEAEYGSRLAEF